jgi:hypothetical protein
MATMLRPMNITELLDRPFFLYRQHFWVLAGIVAIPNLVQLIYGIVSLELQASVGMSGGVVLVLIQIVIIVMTHSISLAASVSAISDIHLGRPASIGAAYARIKGRMIAILLTMFFMGLVCFFGCCCFYVPGIFLFVALSIAVPAALIEGKGPFKSLQRSFELTKGSWWKIFLTILLVSGVSYIFVIILVVPFTVVITALSIKDPHILRILYWLQQIFSFLASCIAIPLPVIAISLIYFNQRVSKEGFDLQLMMSSIKSQQNASASSTA